MISFIIVSLLFQPIDEEGRTALNVAARHHQVEVLDYLLTLKNIDVNKANKEREVAVGNYFILYHSKNVFLVTMLLCVLCDYSLID
jgi:ankyrin repeat protein